MTNEELAGVDELVGRLELGDLAAIPEAATVLQSLITTAREAEALRAESARLRGALGLIIENESADTGYGNSSAKIARAALRASRRLDRGRAVVPVKPTVAMKMAGAAAITEDHMAKMANYDAAIDCWAAMLNEWLDGGHDDD